MNLSGKRILVTGATGFIGNRLVEVLAAIPNVRIRALVPRFMNASRIARYPIEMCGGSILDRDAVSAAMSGVDVVFHLAFGTQGSDKERWQTTVEGTRLICEEALNHRICRIVYTSTFSVYGITGDGNLTEDVARRKSGDIYADSKLKAEQVILSFTRKQGLPAVILQPTIVYGPYSFWSRWPIQQFMEGVVVLPEGEDGLCNAVYVDDLVNALLLSACSEGQEGEVFLISGGKPCRWSEYYSGYARMIDDAEVEYQPLREIKKWLREQENQHGLNGTLKRVLRSRRLRRELASLPAIGSVYRETKRMIPLSVLKYIRSRLEALEYCDGKQGFRRRCYPLAPHLNLLQSKTHVRIDKAADKLGYRPQTDLSTGLARAEQWARWYGLLPSPTATNSDDARRLGQT